MLEPQWAEICKSRKQKICPHCHKIVKPGKDESKDHYLKKRKFCNAMCVSRYKAGLEVSVW